MKLPNLTFYGGCGHMTTNLEVEHCEKNLHSTATWPFPKSGRLKEVQLYSLTSVWN